jgi:hypothetical protein
VIDDAAVSLHDFLAADHERLDALLRACDRDAAIDMVAYDSFRRGLLRHIAIEEKLLMPAVRKREPDLADQLHRDHAALAALLVPPPTAAEIQQIRSILAEHNPLEEGPDGMYAISEEIAGADLERLMDDVQRVPAVPVAPHVDTEVTRESIAHLLRKRSRK